MEVSSRAGAPTVLIAQARAPAIRQVIGVAIGVVDLGGGGVGSGSETWVGPALPAIDPRLLPADDLERLTAAILRGILAATAPRRRW